MLVAQDRTADDRQIRVGADKIVRELRHKVEQLVKHRGVDHHWYMLFVKHDAVLVIVAVGRILQIPRLPVDLDRYGTEILTGRVVLISCKSHIFRAKLTFWIRGRFARACLGDIARIFFGLRAVDGDVQHAVVGIAFPLHILGDSSGAYIVGLLADVIIPVGRLFRRFFISDLKIADNLTRHRRYDTHQQGVEQIAVGSGILDHAVFAGIVDQRLQQFVHGSACIFNGFVLPVVDVQRVHQLIADNQFIYFFNEVVFDRVIDQFLNTCVNHGILLCFYFNAADRADADHVTAACSVQRVHLTDILLGFEHRHKRLNRTGKAAAVYPNRGVIA